MTKKEYLLAFLERMSPGNDIALAISILVNVGNMWDEMINQLYTIIEWSIKSVNNKKEMEKFENLQQVIKKIQNAENNQNDIWELDAMLASL